MTFQALPSCTISVRDPLLTTPKGRQQFDVRIAPFGGLGAFCDLPDCDGVENRGLGVNLWGVDQSVAGADPPAGFVNTLAVSSTGEMYNKQGPHFQPVTESYQLGDVLVPSGTDETSIAQGDALTASVTNPTSAACIVRRRVSVLNASVENPPADAIPDNVTLDLDNSNTVTGTLSSADVASLLGRAADVTYRLNVDNGLRVNLAAAMTGQVSRTSPSVTLPSVLLEADGTYQMSVQPEIFYLRQASDRFLIGFGTVQLELELVCPDVGETFTEADL